jgi:putative YhdH/YhfP family quinone oxidoreductase
MTTHDSFPAYVVTKSEDGAIRTELKTLSTNDLPPGEVLIQVACSSLNYKDALSATGHPGVTRTFPHVPGIDAAGKVLASDDARFKPGDEVLVTGYGMGENRWGGWAGKLRVPAEWIVPLPAGLTLREAMIYGTAGFTAGQSVMAIVEREIDPARGPVAVTGASGGVGSLAVAMLAKAGYEVVAVTGKSSAHSLLKQLGASEIVGRAEVNDSSTKPLLAGRWSAAIDTVGGNVLATLLRGTMHRAVVTCCGLVAGTDLPLTVYPFLLRGVNLVGIDSAQCPMQPRLQVWRKLAGDWKLADLESLATTVTLAGIGEKVQEILQAKITGRTVVVPEKAVLE